MFIACDNKDSNVESNTKVADSNAINIEQSTNDTKSIVDSNASNPISSTLESNSTVALNNTIEQTSQTKTPQELYKKCIACHGENGDKVAPGSVGNVLIANLSRDSIIESMKGYRAKTLSKGGTSAIMYLQANGLSDKDIEVLGEYISTLKK
ncbi:hypothetical protein CQA44_00225 [Helicobacter sp. MIT 14-3879]|nr:hypothetical protein CQA44_00225 [Helicobacter sp. MIT 14-3879]